MSNHSTQPIWPSGSNGLEARVKALEVAQAYDMRDARLMDDRLKQLSQQINEDRQEFYAWLRKGALWLISSLLASVAALVLIVVKIKAPWLISP